jgi:hypothetical protein
MLIAEGVIGDFLEYKGRPLVRKDEDFYYGDMSAEYYVLMSIMSEKKAKNDIEIPDLMVVQLMKKGEKKPIKQATPKGLYEALDTASAWLDRYK